MLGERKLPSDGRIKQNKVSIKEFYQNWLELVQPLVSKDSELFPESKYKRLKELSFSSISSHPNVKGIEEKIIIDDANGYNDFRTLEEVDDFLIKLLGYRPYSLLKIGLLTIKKQESGFKVIPMTHNFKFIFAILDGHNILNLNSKSISPSKRQDSSTVMELISSILLLGYYQRIDIFDKKGKLIEGKSIKKLTSLPNDKFLNKLFGNYQPTLMNSLEFSNLNKEFLNAFSQRKKSGKGFFTEVFVQNEDIQRHIVSGWKTIYNIMYEALESQIKKEYDKNYKDGKVHNPLLYSLKLLVEHLRIIGNNSHIWLRHFSEGLRSVLYLL